MELAKKRFLGMYLCCYLIVTVSETVDLLVRLFGKLCACVSSVVVINVLTVPQSISEWRHFILNSAELLFYYGQLHV